MIKELKHLMNITKLDNNTEIDVSPEYQEAIDAIEDGKNLLITGPAGTGKSTFLKYIKNKYEDKNIVIVAPTGVAALNAGGQTIHSFFKFKPQVMKPEDVKLLRSREAYKHIDILIIDEVSMVRGDIFDSIDRFLRLHSNSRRSPFGGVQVVLVGDLYQLPPVVGGSERKFFKSLYDCPFFFSTEAYDSGKFHCIEFIKMYRQKDKAFIALLNKVRTGDITSEMLDDLNTREMKHFDISEVRLLDPVILTGRNVRAHENKMLQGHAIDNICNMGMGSSVQLELSKGFENYFLRALQVREEKLSAHALMNLLPL